MIKTAQLSINLHIEDLKNQLSQNELKKLEYVILAHPDDRMIDQLKRAFVDSAIAVIAMPQSCWAMDDDQMEELMHWLLNDLNVTRLLLVGHSKGGHPSDNVQVCNSGTLGLESDKGNSSNRVSSILDRVRQLRSCVEQNEKHFVRELEHLKSLPSVQQHFMRNQHFVQGLFYRAESGVFCHYDSTASEFRAVVFDQ